MRRHRQATTARNDGVNDAAEPFCILARSHYGTLHTSLASAHRSLWDNCRVDLEQLGLTFHLRWDSEKRSVADALLTDLLVAFDKLEKIPDIFCEARDLIKLPTLVLDPVLRKLDDNKSLLESLAEDVHNLPNKVTTALSEPVTNCCSTIDDLIANVKPQLEQFLSSVKSFAKTTKKLSVSSLMQVSGSTQSSSTRTNVISEGNKYDRSNNVILFGLPESTLLDMKSEIDEVSTFLIGRPVKLLDAFRLDVNQIHLILALVQYSSSLAAVGIEGYC